MADTCHPQDGETDACPECTCANIRERNDYWYCRGCGNRFDTPMRRPYRNDWSSYNALVKASADDVTGRVADE
jgi:ribosomal protein L37AE/L43A